MGFTEKYLNKSLQLNCWLIFSVYIYSFTSTVPIRVPAIDIGYYNNVAHIVNKNYLQSLEKSK